MKEKELLALGFEKCFGDADEPDWYYFTYDFGIEFSLISNASDELVDGEWVVEVFENDRIRFTSSSEIMALIDLIKRNTVGDER
jgi:hypothetical protein